MFSQNRLLSEITTLAGWIITSQGFVYWAGCG